MQIQLSWDDFCPNLDQNCHLASIFWEGLSRLYGCVCALYSPIQRCSCISTKQWFPHPDSLITCCTKRNKAPLWTSLPQRHRWACYYSNSSEFAGKEGLSLWHTSCPLKRPTERWLCGPYFQAPALMPERERRWRGFKANVQSHGIGPCPLTSNQTP